MKIRDRLAIYFTLISTLTLLGILCAIYITFHKFMEADFYTRLNDRTMVTAKLYLEADEISADSLERVRQQYLETLNGEVIRIYNSKNIATFIGDDQQYWSDEIINRVRRLKKLNFKDGERQVVGIFYKDNQGDFVILVSAIDQSTHHRIEKLRRIMGVTFIIVFLGLLIFGRWIAKEMLKPLGRLVGEVKKIKSNNLHFRVQEGRNKDEINLLAQTFNNLMDHLEQAFILQKTFIDNASHELRTPITRMVISTELALSQERSSSDYRETLSSVLEDVEKLNDVISGLVNLAQADMEYGLLQMQPIRIDEMLWSLSEEWNRRAKQGKLLVNIENMPEDPSELLVEADPTLLFIAFNNIVSNAFKFSDQKDVKCLMRLHDTKISIEISDQGIGVNSESIEKIFKPFYSFSVEERHQGAGMGLYMAHKIILLFKGTLTVVSETGNGSTFAITLPKF